MSMNGQRLGMVIDYYTPAAEVRGMDSGLETRSSSKIKVAVHQHVLEVCVGLRVNDFEPIVQGR